MNETMTRHGFKDGELLPAIGGPRDGDQLPVSVLYPLIRGDEVPCKIIPIGWCHWYWLDAETRRWLYRDTRLESVEIAI